MLWMCKGYQRVQYGLLSIVQMSVAAGLAYFVALDFLHHTKPFFAPMAAIIMLGLNSGNRLKKAVELSIGCSLGVGLGDFLIYGIGSGYWQLALAVFISLFLATFLSSSQLLINQVAIGSILISTIMPPGSAAATDRMIDAFIGCGFGILTMALLPHSPLAEGRREVAKVLTMASEALTQVSTAMRTGDVDGIREALRQARGSQAAINAMIAAAKSGQEEVAVSPFLWSSKARVRSFVRILHPVDNAMRNTRVLARRAQVLIEDGDEVSEAQIQLIDDLVTVTSAVAAIYDRRGAASEAAEIPELVRTLQTMAARAGLSVAEGKVLSAQVVLAQTRSIIVDLLQVCGMSRASAVASLALTSESPAYPSEIRDDPNH